MTTKAGRGQSWMNLSGFHLATAQSFLDMTKDETSRPDSATRNAATACVVFSVAYAEAFVGELSFLLSPEPGGFGRMTPATISKRVGRVYPLVERKNLLEKANVLLALIDADELPKSKTTDFDWLARWRNHILHYSPQPVEVWQAADEWKVEERTLERELKKRFPLPQLKDKGDHHSLYHDYVCKAGAMWALTTAKTFVEDFREAFGFSRQGGSMLAELLKKFP